MKASGVLMAAILTIFAAGFAGAQQSDVSPEQKIADSLKYQTGKIELGNNLATLNLPEGFRFLGPKDAQTVLTQLWGNPPGEELPMGMIVPANSDVLTPGGWAIVVTYEEDGHVKDDDAASINYGDLLKEMQASSVELNKEREKEGYEPVQIVGWAASPRYDAAGKKLYWAKELEFGSDPEHTLNYNIRILGRTGVLVLNAIASTKELPVIEKATPELLAAVSFNPGSRYEDFNESTDKMAAYGIAALVAGGVAAKAGLFKGLWLGILAFKKFIIIGLLAVGASIKNLFTRKKSPYVQESQEKPQP